MLSYLLKLISIILRFDFNEHKINFIIIIIMMVIWYLQHAMNNRGYKSICKFHRRATIIKKKMLSNYFLGYRW